MSAYIYDARCQRGHAPRADTGARERHEADEEYLGQDTGMHAGARGARQIGTISRDNIGRADESE